MVFEEDSSRKPAYTLIGAVSVALLIVRLPVEPKSG